MVGGYGPFGASNFVLTNSLSNTGVLISDESDLLLQGRWWGQAPEVDGSVYLANGTAQAGEFRRVLVTDAADYDLMAFFIDAPGGRDAPPDAKDPRPPKVKLRTLS